MSFLRNARTMLFGFALAQALPLLAAPLLTRLFSPEAFGLQALFVSTTSVLLVLSILRMDLAIVLADNRREATDIATIGALQALVVGGLVLLAAALFAPELARRAGFNGSPAWVWAVAPTVLAMAVVQLSGGLLTWEKRFGPTARAQVVNQATYLATAIALGLKTMRTDGLVAAKLAGQSLAALLLARQASRTLDATRLPPREVRAPLWRKCRPFLFFNTPYSLVSTIGREVPIFAFSAISATAAAGFYGLARTLLGAPATLMAGSLSQVFYREAAEHRGTERLRLLTAKLLLVTLAFTAPAIAFVAVWGDDAFALVFGERWRTAGTYAMVLAIPAWLSIQTAWPERLYESVGRQSVSFAVQVGFDVVTTLAVFGAAWSGIDPLGIVVLFAIVNSVFHLTYMTGMFWVAGFGVSTLVPVLGRGLALFAAIATAMLACRFLPAPWGLVLAAICAALACAAVGWRGYGAIRSLGEASG